ncbi:hypothetical protein AXA44_25330 [Rhodococcus sp. SC4]|uniref:hypothetical protein n=1 Tax=unclassified Rhodococcus (in: high G+C Gram-positive bacteria) TaxID=192944 RepID=UPI00076ACE16|nr:MULTISPECIES: hypothetical protein [unclassified Rhodococcus (in: high G+C Gram-positive bacteria)]KXF49248.1 hypothetical protein AXA44_25330 [Rhodococcus sp. SC4]KXX63149.1 hypothetical protein AZG88_26420 [Rhodococcus sp. LB1]PBC56404.1 hypothetical protein CJ177_12150 [Rhodococcus sp. ACPA1]
MDADYDSALEEKPLEFMASIANTGGSCDGQGIIPDGDHYTCWCSCGEWNVEAPDQHEGLRLARLHTGSIAE